MLEVRYNKTTKRLTGWWGDRFGNEEAKLKGRPDEAIATLDCGIPDKPADAWLYDGATISLISTPEYIEPKPPRDLVAEIDALSERVDSLGIK